MQTHQTSSNVRSVGSVSGITRNGEDEVPCLVLVSPGSSQFVGSNGTWSPFSPSLSFPCLGLRSFGVEGCSREVLIVRSSRFSFSSSTSRLTEWFRSAFTVRTTRLLEIQSVPTTMRQNTTTRVIVKTKFLFWPAGSAPQIDLSRWRSCRQEDVDAPIPSHPLEFCQTLVGWDRQEPLLWRTHVLMSPQGQRCSSTVLTSLSAGLAKNSLTRSAASHG